MGDSDPGPTSKQGIIFVTGVNGQLGHDVMNELARRGMDAVGSDITEEYAGIPEGPAFVAERGVEEEVAKGEATGSSAYRQLDITDREAVFALLRELQPAAVIHCAAWTAVDAAEEPENLETVRAINVAGTEYIAEACKEIDAKMLYLSTDYVFDGEGEEPWDPDFPDFAPQILQRAEEVPAHMQEEG